ncbi:hypothetical protein [Megalodesulfovibrio paquesii]
MSPQHSHDRESSRQSKPGAMAAPVAEQIDTVTRVLQSGGSLDTAAAAANVSRETLDAWLTLGEEAIRQAQAGGKRARPPRRSGARALLEQACQELATRARTEVARTEAACLEAIRRSAVEGETVRETVRVVGEDGSVLKETSTTKQAAPQWKAAVWWLEHVLPGMWGDKSEQPEGGGPVYLTIVPDETSEGDGAQDGDAQHAFTAEGDDESA